MAFTAGISLVNLRGAGEHGIGLEVKAATTASAQTINFYPFKLTDSTNVMVLRDVSPNDTAGAISSVSLAATGITLTAASAGNIGLLIVGAVQRA